jgi:hypothetical protein
MGKHGWVAGWFFAAGFVATLLGVAPGVRADDECLVAVHDTDDNAITEGEQVCLNGKACVFNLKACLNDPDDTCAAGAFKSKKKIRAKGHCGAIGHLSVTPSGSTSLCGGTAGIKVHTKANGKKTGKCNIRISSGRTTDGRGPDIDKFTLLCQPTTDPCPTTTTTTITVASTTTTTGLPCPGGCAAQQIVTSTGAGILAVSTLPAFPFPSGVSTTINTGPPLGGCRHDAIVPSGGFTVPVFCIPALGYTSQVTPLGCASGGSDGKGFVWDTNDPTKAAPDADVLRTGDTSDGTCDTTVQGGPPPQHCTSAPGGAGGNTNGNIDTIRGDGVVDPPGVHTQLDIPVHSLTWQDNDGTPDCPDEDGTFDPAVDVVITDFNFILSPTTAKANAQFVDQNGDGCSRAGNGPNATQHCVGDATKPCGANSDCGGAVGSCAAGAIQGTPATGPCCVVGQTTTVVATGLAFTGGSPLYDLIFSNMSPTTITACNPAVTLGACTLSNDPCQD